jgi:glycosyltransferase involved in cell wall biosynthesis
LEVDPKEYAPKDIPTEFPSVVFSGTMSYYPNHEAAIYFTKHIFPMILERFPKTKFYVVGKNPGHEIMRLSSDNVIVTGEVKTVQEFLLKSNVVVVPLLNGGGMRLKILEAFSLSKAVVSTLLGAEGIEYTDGKDILIADDPKAFADKVCCLLENVEKAKELGINARELVEKEYSVNAVWEKWKDLYERLIW